jgi:hypothetical protein
MSPFPALSRQTFEEEGAMGRGRRGSGIVAAVIQGAAVGVAAAAQVSSEAPAVNPYTFTPERIVASAAVVVGLTSAVIGGLALARAVRRIGAGGRRGATVALVMGPIAFVFGGLIVATADGGLGTGNGLAGGVVAMLMGVIGIGLGWLAVTRSRRVA